MKAMQKWLAKKKNGKKGFSLAELMLVVMIMAILITIIVVSGGGIQTYVNETIMKTEAKQVMNYCSIALSQYASETSGQLLDPATCDTTIETTTSSNETPSRFEVTFLNSGLNREPVIVFATSNDTSGEDEIEASLLRVIDGGLTDGDIIQFSADLSENGFSYNIVTFSYTSAKRNMEAALSASTGEIEIVSDTPESTTPPETT